MNDSLPHELISAYLDGELNAAEREEAERLLAENAEARQYCDELRSLRADVAALPRQRAGGDFSARLLAAVAAAKIEPANDPVAGNGKPSEKLLPAAHDPGISAPVSGTSVATPRRENRPGDNLSWAAVVGLLGTLAAGIVAILAVPRMMNEVARQNLPEAPKNVQPAAAPMKPQAPAPPNAAATGQARDPQQAAVAVSPEKPRGPEGISPEETRKEASPPVVAKPLANQIAREQVERFNNLGGAHKEKESSLAKGALRGVGEEDMVRRSFAKQGIAWQGQTEEQAAVAQQSDRDARFARRFREGKDEAAAKYAEAITKLRGDAGDSYYLIEAPAAQVEQLVADLKAQGASVEIAPATEFARVELAKADGMRKKIAGPDAVFGGGRGIAPGGARAPSPAPPRFAAPKIAPADPAAPRIALAPPDAGAPGAFAPGAPIDVAPAPPAPLAAVRGDRRPEPAASAAPPKVAFESDLDQNNRANTLTVPLAEKTEKIVGFARRLDARELAPETLDESVPPLGDTNLSPEDKAPEDRAEEDANAKRVASRQANAFADKLGDAKPGDGAAGGPAAAEGARAERVQVLLILRRPMTPAAAKPAK